MIVNHMHKSMGPIKHNPVKNKNTNLGHKSLWHRMN